MIDLNKFTGTKKADILHSNGVAKDATTGMGAAGATSFRQRLDLAARGNRLVQSYNRSMVGAVRIDRRAQEAQILKRYQPPQNNQPVNQNRPLSGRSVSRSANGRQAFNASSNGRTTGATSVAAPRELFYEPPTTHNYDPYR